MVMTEDMTTQGVREKIASCVGQPIDVVREIDFAALTEDVQRYILPDERLYNEVSRDLKYGGKLYFDGRLHWVVWHKTGDLVPIPVLKSHPDFIGLIECIPDSAINVRAATARDLWLPNLTKTDPRSRAWETQYNVAQISERRKREYTANVIMYRVDMALGGTQVEITRFDRPRWYITRTGIDQATTAYDALDDFEGGDQAAVEWMYPGIICVEPQWVREDEDEEPGKVYAAYLETEPDPDDASVFGPKTTGQVEIREWRIYDDDDSWGTDDWYTTIVKAKTVTDDDIQRIEQILRDERKWRPSPTRYGKTEYDNARWDEAFSHAPSDE